MMFINVQEVARFACPRFNAVLVGSHWQLTFITVDSIVMTKVKSSL
jgi:hypothetical protein